MTQNGSETLTSPHTKSNEAQERLSSVATNALACRYQETDLEDPSPFVFARCSTVARLQWHQRSDAHPDGSLHEINKFWRVIVFERCHTVGKTDASVSKNEATKSRACPQGERSSTLVARLAQLDSVTQDPYPSASEAQGWTQGVPRPSWA